MNRTEISRVAQFLLTHQVLAIVLTQYLFVTNSWNNDNIILVHVPIGM